MHNREELKLNWFNKKSQKLLTKAPTAISPNENISTEQENELLTIIKKSCHHILLWSKRKDELNYLARKMFYNCFEVYDRLAWVEFNGSIEHSLLIAFEDYLNSNNISVNIQNIINCLNNSTKRTIIFIEDVNAELLSEDILRRLTGLNASIFLTSTSNNITQYESYQLEKISINNCLSLFYKNCCLDSGKVEDEIIEKIIGLLDNNMVAVILFAKHIKSIEEIYQYYIKLLEEKKSKFNKEPIIVYHLENILKRINLSEEEENVLGCLSLLPQKNITEHSIEILGIDKKTIESIYNKGLLKYNLNSNVYEQYELIRDFIAKNKITSKLLEKYTNIIFQSSLFNEDYSKDDILFVAFCLENIIKTTEDETLKYGRLSWSLAELYSWIEERDKAINVYNNILNYEKDLSPENPYKLSLIYHYLGDLYQKKGCLQEALDNYMCSRKYFESDSNKMVSDLSYLDNDIALAYQKLGDYKNAYTYYDSAIKSLEKNNIQSSEIYADICNNIGTLYFNIDCYTEGLKYLDKALSIWKEKTNDFRPKLFSLYVNMGNIYRDLFDLKNANENFLSAKKLYDNDASENKLKIAICDNNIASVCVDKAEYQKAKIYYENALNIYRERLGTNHPDTSLLFSNLGELYYWLGDNEKAFYYQQKALDIQKSIFSGIHPYIAISYQNLAFLYLNSNNKIKAKDYLDRAITILTEIYSDKNHNVADCYNDIGDYFITEKKYDEAIICYGRAKEINQNIFSDNHISIAICNDKLCYAYSLLDNNKKALEHSQKALKVMKKVFTKKHPNISDAYFHLAVVYKNLEKYEKAFTYFYKAYLIDFELFGKMHQRTQIKGKYLEELFKKIYPDKDFQNWLEENS